MNEAYSDFGIAFVKAGYDLVCDASYFSSGCDRSAVDTEYYNMKNALALSPATQMNLYYLDCLSQGLLGLATLPFGMHTSSEQNNKFQGIVIDYRSVRGGGAGMEGDTTVHEVGHYFGLYHTFHGGCHERSNDMVSDTPRTGVPNGGKCGDPKAPSNDPAAIEAYCKVGHNCGACDVGEGVAQWNFMDYRQASGCICMYICVQHRRPVARSN